MSSDSEMLNDLQRETFDYFLQEVDPHTGLIADKNQPGTPASVAGVGMGLSAYCVAVEKGFMTRSEAIDRTLRILRFFEASHQGTEAEASGYKGFYYHFLEMDTGKRAWNCELSTIDTTFFIAGALSSAAYFTGSSAEETEIRKLADFLYRRIDWVWALNGKSTVCHGWKPDTGFLQYHWDRDYSEAMLLYLLALGSPTHPLGENGYSEWTRTFQWKELYGLGHLYAGPLFIHQFSQMWVDFRGVRDEFGRAHDIDYFENSRRATLVQQQYAIENPQHFAHYGEHCWGFTASDGPGIAVMKVEGVDRIFYDYLARGAPFGPDDGTVSPWAVVASLPFAPEIVIDTIRHAIEKLELKNHRLYGFDASFNPTFPDQSKNPNGWVSPWRFALNQGPIVLMIENFQSGLIWQIMKGCPYLQDGLKRAGFRAVATGSASESG